MRDPLRETTHYYCNFLWPRPYLLYYFFYSDVLSHLDHGLQHVIQAGIDRVNQGVRMTAHMISDWRIMPQFTYEVIVYI